MVQENKEIQVPILAQVKYQHLQTQQLEMLKPAAKKVEKLWRLEQYFWC